MLSEKVGRTSIVSDLQGRIEAIQREDDGPLVRVQLMAVSFSSLLDWLNDSHLTARLAVVDANIVAQPSVGTVNATLTLQRQDSGSLD